MNSITQLKLLILIFVLFVSLAEAQTESSFTMVRLKYSGGGDWYNDPSAEVNLLRFIKSNTNIKVKDEYKFVDLSSEEIFSHPFLFMTGHGNITFSSAEADRLRKYLEAGGFLYIDDDYGLDKALRREMKKVFPLNDFVELPFTHPIYSNVFDFTSGPPKTHKHDENPPQGFGIYVEKRLAVFYTFESNPSDGWADPDVHNDPVEKREESLKFGTNIVVYALTN